jgi:uncharacterized protein YndB with AHSA1/START domain
MPNIRHELIIGAPAGKVYDAVTSQEGLSAWWTPGVKAKAERDSIAHFPFGPEYFKEMKIVELDPPNRVKWNCLAGEDEWVGTTISFEIRSGDRESLLRSRPEARGQIQQQSGPDAQTLLVFNHDDWKAYTPMFAECNYTWGRFLRSLKLYCETGKGRPWPHQHRAAA